MRSLWQGMPMPGNWTMSMMWMPIWQRPRGCGNIYADVAGR
jgi:hypothetical protein